MHAAKLILAMLAVSVAIAAAAASLGGCKSGCRSGEGGSCENKDDCHSGLACIEGRCGVDATLHQKMALQSGVVVRGERPAPSPGGEGAVRVRSAQGDGFALAVCGDDERLISGWCDPTGVGDDNTDFTFQSIDGQTETDTIGARWKCQLADEAVRAFALCQKVATTPSPTTPSPTTPTPTTPSPTPQSPPQPPPPPPPPSDPSRSPGLRPAP